MKVLDLIGQKFERLLVIQRVKNNKYGCSQWLCRCDCGKEKIILGNNLIRNITKSCGCLQKERATIGSKIHNTIHGHAKNSQRSKTYVAWHDMLQRCNNPKDEIYKYYGGRGIKVCNRWLEFKNFLEDIGEIPKNLSLDRIDNHGNYSLENCKLSTMKEQSRNKRSNVNITYEGKIWCLNDLAKEHNIHKDTLRYRLKIGLSIEEALTLPVGKGKLK